ncbi:MAG: gliding motility-associated-like protein [Vicingaceae bacterium]|jgi:gliding motility-associated-like protein
MKIINSLALTCLLLISGFISAQAPSWSVNPNRFQYSMTVTAILDLNCVELQSPSNQLGAFVGDSLRGTAFTSTVIGGRYEASMFIYSDLVNGEQVSLRFYQLSSDSIYLSVDTIAFQDNAIYGSPLNPFAIRNNAKPNLISISSDTLAENQPTGATVGTLSTVDSDAGQTHSYSLVSGTGSTNNGSFSISGTNLIANFIPDFETKPSYTIRIRTTDNLGCSYELPFTIFIKDVNDAPSSLSLSNNQINENQSPNATIGNLMAVDTDANEVFTYSFVAGAGGSDNSAFNLSGSALRTNAALDFETKSTYSVRLQVADRANNLFVDTFKITVNDINDAPTDVVINSDSVLENLPINTVVATLSTTDQDAGQNFAYSFDNVPGNNNADFNIVGNQLRARQIFDFENTNTYFIYVQTNDLNGGTYTKQLTIRIIDANDTPSDLQLSNASVNENRPTGTFVAELITTDQDANNTFTYSLVNGVGDADNGNFSVQNDSIFTSVVLDLNTQATHTIRVQTNDGNSGTFAKAFTIFVKDVNNVPTDMVLSNNIIAENTIIGSEVGSITTTDADAGDGHTYTLVAGVGDANNMSFSISADKLLTNTTFDVNIRSTYSVRIQANDGFGGIYQEAFTINITNSNDVPTDISLTPNSFKENLPQSSFIGAFATADKDSADTFSYSFVNQGTNDNASFIISSNELRTGRSFDFETKNLYVIEVQTRDNTGATYSRQLTVNVVDSNDAPTALAISADSIFEKSPVGTFVADLSTTDADATDNFTYSLVAGQGANDNALFRINGSLLEVDSILNFNNSRTRSIRIETTDKGGRTLQNSFVIRVLNQNDLPTDILLSDTTVNENASIGTRVAILTSVDEDPTSTFIYSLVAGSGDAGNSSFAIDGNELKTNSTFDFETQASYSIRIRTTDSQGGSLEKTFNIALTNGNEKPSIDAQFFSISENSTPNTIIGTVTATDLDANETFSYSILGTQIDFSINAVTAELSSSRTFNYEINNSYTIEIQVSDAGGLKDTATVTIEILDLIEGSLPTAGYFSPNGDGRNDEWKIQNVELYSDFSLKIFSVQGVVVYDNPNNYNNDWRGTFNGTELPEGIYYYYFENTANPSQNFKGVITLKR